MHYQDQVKKEKTVTRGSEDVAVGAGRVLLIIDNFPQFVQAAFTPIINENGNVEVFDWGISESGILTQENTPVDSFTDNNYEVAACMLAEDAPITVHGYGNGYVSIGKFGDGSFTYSATPSTDETDGVSSIAAAAAGDDYNVTSPSAEFNAYFVTAVMTYYTSSDVGKLEIKKWSYAVLPTL